MFRTSQLKEIQLELNRARVIAESLNLTDIALTLNDTLNQINQEIQKETPKPATTTGRRTSSKTDKESS